MEITGVAVNGPNLEITWKATNPTVTPATEKMFGSYPFPPNLYERNYVEFIAVFVKPGAARKVPPKVKEASRLTQAEWMDLTRQIWWMYPDNVPRLAGRQSRLEGCRHHRSVCWPTGSQRSRETEEHGRCRQPVRHGGSRVHRSDGHREADRDRG